MRTVADISHLWKIYSVSGDFNLRNNFLEPTDIYD